MCSSPDGSTKYFPSKPARTDTLALISARWCLDYAIRQDDRSLITEFDTTRVIRRSSRLIDYSTNHWRACAVSRYRGDVDYPDAIASRCPNASGVKSRGFEHNAVTRLIYMQYLPRAQIRRTLAWPRTIRQYPAA